jgi:drug/metabolite transporter (DMT)-like permease
LNTKNEKLFAWLAFAAVSFFWGTTYLGIRIGVQSFPPFLLAGFRNSISGIILCSWFLLRGYKMPSLKSMKVFAINGFLMLVLGNGLVTWAEIYVSSGLAALICSLTPIWIVMFNAMGRKKEKVSMQIVIGLAICLAGQLLIFNDNIRDFANPNYTLGIVCILIANLAWAMGSIYSKNHKSDVNPLFGAGLQMVVGGLLLDMIGTYRGEWGQLHPTPDAIWALVYLIVAGSIIAYSAYMYVLQKLPATVISTYAYINTIVAVILGWFWLDEKLNMVLAIAVLMTIGGVWLINKSMNSTKTK